MKMIVIVRLNLIRPKVEDHIKQTERRRLNVEDGLGHCCNSIIMKTVKA